MPSHRIALSPKAVSLWDNAVAASTRPDLEALNSAAGWDADAGFAQARVKMKLADGVPIHHRFVKSDGKMFHEYYAR